MRHSRCVHFAAILAASLIFLLVGPPMAIADSGWEGSKTEKVLAQTVDVILIRPLAILRTVVGAAAFLPAALLASPGGRAKVEEVYELFVTNSADYAFRRDLGDL